MTPIPNLYLIDTENHSSYTHAIKKKVLIKGRYGRLGRA